MGWTSPATWVTAAQLTAAQLNQQLRDNLLELNGTTSVWAAYTPTLTGFPATTSRARWKQIGKLVHVSAKFTLTGAATGAMSVSLPVNANAAYAPTSTSPETVGTVVVAQTGSGWFQGVASLLSVSAVYFHATQGGDQFGVTVPFTWASGHVFSVALAYEAV